MLWSFFASYNLSYGLAPRITSWAATAMVVFYATMLARPASFKQVLGIGLLWACMHLLFDVVYVIPAAGLAAFSTYFAWINYAIVFATPLVAFLYTKTLTSPAQRIDISSTPSPSA